MILHTQLLFPTPQLKHVNYLFKLAKVYWKQIAAVNWERKRSQTASGARLRALRRRWAQLVSDNYRLERAIMQLEMQFEKAKQQVNTKNGDRPVVDMDAVKMLPDKLNSETEKEVQKKIEDMFAD